MSFALFWSHLRRESRGQGGRLLFFVVCLSVGVGAVTSVASFGRAIDQGIRGEARQLLAADLSLSSRAPLPQELLDAVAAIDGAEVVHVREMLTVVALPEINPTDAGGSALDPGETPTARSRLTELKSIDGDYPFYGELRLEPPGRARDLLDAESVLVAPELLNQLGVAVGDTLRVGGHDFKIRATVLKEPDRIVGAFSMGPRVFLSAAGLQRAGLEQFGSRILHRLQVKLPIPEQLEAIASRLKSRLPIDGRVRLETYREAQPAMRQGLERMENYLGLAALLSLLIGGVGVAQTVRAWLATRLDAIAILKCLGYRPREVFRLFLGQTLVLGAAASALGIVAGVFLQIFVSRLFAGLLPVENLDLFQPVAWLQGLGLGIGVSVLFSLPPLLTARDVPPIRVLRRSAEPLPPARWTRFLLGASLVLGTAALASWQSQSIFRGLVFTGALLAVTLFLAGGAVLLVRLARRPRESAGLWLRQGLSALARPGASTLSAIVALGLGVLVLLTMLLVESSLSGQLQRELPKNAPTAFLIDIQPDQWPGVEEVLRQGSQSYDSVPVVMARIAGIDGATMDVLAARRAERRRERGDPNANDDWALRREQRLTYLERLPADNVLVEGTLWSDPQRAEVSVEREFANDLDVKLGSVLQFDIQGVPIELTVTSLRTVDWSTFGINFFLVVEPGVLEEAPQFRVAAARIADDKIQGVQDTLAGRFPNVTLIRIREVLDRVTEILGKLGLGVRLLGLLTVLAGLAILAGAVGASQVQRAREVALLKTLGMTRRQVVAAFGTEYALIGLVAGAIGTAGGALLSYLVLTQVMEIESKNLWWLDTYWWPPAALVTTLALAIVAGLLASARALQEKPIAVLRAE